MSLCIVSFLRCLGAPRALKFHGIGSIFAWNSSWSSSSSFFFSPSKASQASFAGVCVATRAAATGTSSMRQRLSIAGVYINTGTGGRRLRRECEWGSAKLMQERGGRKEGRYRVRTEKRRACRSTSVSNHAVPHDIATADVVHCTLFALCNKHHSHSQTMGSDRTEPRLGGYY